jgi:hypothetical protein
MNRERTRAFQTQQLIDWGITHFDDDDDEMRIVAREELGMRSFECRAAIVFRAPDDNKLYRFTYEYNNGAGYNDITGISDKPYKPEQQSFTAAEVVPVTRLIEVTTYESVTDKDGAP